MDNKKKRQEFYEAVYSVVRDIPRGSVATYGMVAMLIGHPQNSRFCLLYTSIHCHGSTAAGIDLSQFPGLPKNVVFIKERPDFRNKLRRRF